MWEVNLPEPDDPLNPEKWEWGAKIRHPESVRQGPSTAIGIPDLRSKRGEFQHKTAQSLRRCTAAMPAATASNGSANLTPGGAHGPPRATGGAVPSHFPPPAPFPGSQRAGPSRPAQKRRRENHLSNVQGLGWKKCVQFNYCSRIPCEQTAGLYFFPGFRWSI